MFIILVFIETVDLIFCPPNFEKPSSIAIANFGALSLLKILATICLRTNVLWLPCLAQG